MKTESITFNNFDSIPLENTRYRVEAIWYCGARTPSIRLLKMMVTKKTPKGTWVNNCGEKRFVLDEGRKRFAVETPEAALESFKARKKAQVRILKANLKRAEADLYAAINYGITDWI